MKPIVTVIGRLVPALAAFACVVGCGGVGEEEQEPAAEEATDNVSAANMTAALCGSSMFKLGRVAPRSMNGAEVKHSTFGTIDEINGMPVEYSQNGTVRSIGGKPVEFGMQGYLEKAYGHPVKMDSFGTIRRVNDKEVGYGWRGRIEKIDSKPVEYDRFGDATVIQGKPVEYVDYGLVKVTSKNRLVLCLAAYGD